MKKLILFASLIALGSASAFAGGRHDHHREYVCHETGRHYHPDHHQVVHRRVEHHSHHYYYNRRPSYNYVNFSYRSSRPHYTYGHRYYNHSDRYYRKYRYERSRSKVRVHHGTSGHINLNF